MAKNLQKTWTERIDLAKKEKQEWEECFRVKLARDYFEGKQNPGYPQDEWITINKIYSHLQAQLPTLYSLDPYYYVRLKKSYTVDPNKIAEFESKGKVRASVLNYLKGELKLKEKARLGIQDAHFSLGIIKVHLSADKKENENAGKPLLRDDEKPMLDPDTGEPLLEPDTIPVNEKYAITRVHPDDFVFLAGSGPLEDKWLGLAERISLTPDEAEKQYGKSAIKKIKPSEVKEDGDKSVIARAKSFFAGDKEGKKPEVYIFWEIYDLVKNEWLTIAEDADDPVRDPAPVPPGIERHPYSFLRFTLRDRSPYPIPPVSQAIDPQKEIGLSRSRMLTHRKRFNRKYEVNVTALEDEAELSKLESGDDGALIRVRQTGAVRAIEDAPLDQQGYTELALLNNDLIEIFGSPDNARGIASADSATEASLLDRRLEIKEGDKMSLVSDWLGDIGRKLDQLAQANLDKEEAIKVTGPQGEFWEKVSPNHYKNIEGEFEYGINVGSTAPRLPDIERAQWIAFMSQVIVPFPHILTSPTIMKRMAEMFHIQDDAALEEFRQLGLKIMSGQMPMPGQSGGGANSQTGAAGVLGAALGQLGGNTNGGGAPGGMMGG